LIIKIQHDDEKLIYSTLLSGGSWANFLWCS